MPEKRLPVLVAAVVAALVGFWAFRIIGAALGFLFVLLSTAELFFPVRFRLDKLAAQSRCGLSVTRISWPDVRRVVLYDGVARLFPKVVNERLAAFRGVTLRFANNEERVVAIMRQFCVEGAVEWVESKER